MSRVGIVTIALGFLALGVRGVLLVTPAAALAWFKNAISTTGRVRVFGLVLSVLGLAMIWGGASDDSLLAYLLSLGGWASTVFSVLALVLFPGVYQSMANTLVPADLSEDLTMWRIGGVLGVMAGVAIIYFGVLAL
jgi:hypothetical protein